MEDMLKAAYAAQKPGSARLAQTATKLICYPVTKLDCDISSCCGAGG